MRLADCKPIKKSATPLTPEQAKRMSKTVEGRDIAPKSKKKKK